VPCNTSPRVCAIAILLLTIYRRLYLLLLIVNRSTHGIDEAERKKFPGSLKFLLRCAAGRQLSARPRLA
jgi:hypothetical protein